MDIYKKGLQANLRFTTGAGILTTEQLFSCGISTIIKLIKDTKKVLVKENDSELAFLEANDTVDVVNQLKFDILKDVYLTMREESKADLEAINKKEFKQKVLNIIANKKDDALINKSIDELEALIKD